MNRMEDMMIKNDEDTAEKKKGKKKKKKSSTTSSKEHTEDPSMSVDCDDNKVNFKFEFIGEEESPAPRMDGAFFWVKIFVEVYSTIFLLIEVIKVFVECVTYISWRLGKNMFLHLLSINHNYVIYGMMQIMCRWI